MSFEKALAHTKVAEGLSLKPYKCPAGYLTIGYGLNLDNGISLEEAEWLLQSRFDNAIRDAVAFVGNPGVWDAMSESRNYVIVCMAYNLGLTRLQGFKNFRKALKAGDYQLAAAEMLDSKWARQVGQRARHLAHIMRTGVWE